MTKATIEKLIRSLIVFMSLAPVPAFAQSGGAPLDPYEVIVFEHADYVGDSLHFKFEPGMRQKLVPVLPEEWNDRISSIQIGAKVAVMVFADADFASVEGHNQIWKSPFQGDSGDCYPIFQESLMVLPKCNDQISSLIVFPKELLQPEGVFLSDAGTLDYGDQFFPLPELLDQNEARFVTLPAMDDDANEVTLYPNDPNSPAYGKVNATLYEHADFLGRQVTLPGLNAPIPVHASFRLHPYQFSDAASSLVVRWLGPTMTVTGMNPVGVATIPAPPLPPTGSGSHGLTAVPDISGAWNSSGGAVYQIQQDGNQFSWQVAATGEKGQGTIQGRAISASWSGPRISGSAQGKITALGDAGEPIRIEWDNGVQFFR